ncbi:MAG: 3-dehydroquinate synthase [Armatimonadetes bacterium]|nr:3-dehydroquinate synthase [Armatimonadota bacterium]
MAEVAVSLGERSYSITIEPGLLSRVGDVLAATVRQKRLAVVTQKRVWQMWGNELQSSLSRSGLECSVIQTPNGESAKSLTWVRHLYSEFARAGIDRSSTVAAFGGGAVGDLAGFAAASWLRGVDFVQIPTTLLAQVDASVGGKVGVNLPIGKNLVGAFWQPRAVLIDSNVLETLPKRDRRSGLAEVIKYGIILDKEFFDYVKSHRGKLLSREPSAIVEAIKRSCELKAYVVTNDERESGLRAILNYGHTIGHAVEAAGKYSGIKHGEAVSIGMVQASRLSVMVGMLSDSECQEIRSVLASFGLPVEVPAELDRDTMLKSIALDKKSKGGRVRFVLARGIGQVELSEAVTPEMVASVIHESQEVS